MAGVAMKMSDSFRAEFRELIDEVEPWLESQGSRKWSDYVVYVTDATPEFERGETDQKIHGEIVSKGVALARETSYGTEASSRLAELFRRPQVEHKVWVVASSAANTIQVVECEVYTLPSGAVHGGVA